MKPYYRKNGFFDLLERFSDWIDWEICNFRWRVEESIDYFKLFGFMYFIPGFRTLSFSRYYIKYHSEELEKAIDMYNATKPFWMAKK